MKTFLNKVTFVTEMTTPDGKTVRVILPESMVLDFSLGVGFKPEIVEELPETGDPRVIYLVPAEEEKAGNIYVEWLYIDDKWECIGSTAVEMNLLIGTEEQRLALINPKEGIEFNEVHAADPEDPESKAHVVRYIRENGEWVQLESPQTESEETVSLHVTTWDGEGTVEGLNVGIIDNTTHATYSRILDHFGNCSFKIAKGHTYTITVEDLSGYHSLPDETFKASMDERTVTMVFQPVATNYETVIAHITVYNKNLIDVTNQDTDFVGLAVELQVEGEATPRTGIIGQNHQCTFTVEYGKTYSLTAPTVEGYRVRFNASKQFTHTAGVPQRELPMHYMEWDADGVFGLDASGATFDYDTIEAMTEQERASIIAIGLNTSRLQAANAGFCYKRPLATAGKQWANQNVEFDQTLLPFKTSHAAAVLDLNGAQNTQNIIDIGDSMGVETPAADYCQSQTLTIGGETKTGFLGAYGQMYALAENIAVLNALHSLLGIPAPGFTGGRWWTSTQCNAGTAVTLYLGSFINDSKNYSYTTVALFALS